LLRAGSGCYRSCYQFLAHLRFPRLVAVRSCGACSDPPPSLLPREGSSAAWLRDLAAPPLSRRDRARQPDPTPRPQPASSADSGSRTRCGSCFCFTEHDQRYERATVRFLGRVLSERPAIGFTLADTLLDGLSELDGPAGDVARGHIALALRGAGLSHAADYVAKATYLAALMIGVSPNVARKVRMKCAPHHPFQPTAVASSITRN
jgi:hypothetical protein